MQILLADQIFNDLCASCWCTETVSYTHLDVYKRQSVYLVLNKPANFECSHKPKFHPSIYTLLPRPLLTRGVQAVGRLDEDTTGLLLLSDDGQFIHTFTSPKKRIPKVYDVSVKHPFDERQATALLSGVQLNDESEPTSAVGCQILAERLVRLTVTEGKYHLSLIHI